MHCNHFELVFLLYFFWVGKSWYKDVIVITFTFHSFLIGKISIQFFLNLGTNPTIGQQAMEMQKSILQMMSRGKRSYTVAINAATQAKRVAIWKVVHGGERSFVCKLCDSSFKLGGRLKRHMTVDSGAKPFNCLQCNYSCATANPLKSHEKNTLALKLTLAKALVTLALIIPLALTFMMTLAYALTLTLILALILTLALTLTLVFGKVFTLLTLMLA